MTVPAANVRFWGPPADAGPEGLVGVGGDLRPATLIRAYREGVFPWFNTGDPILWWCPDPRGIFDLNQIHVSRSLARTLRRGRFCITADIAFRQVMEACATTREEGTWITDRMIAAYCDLHTVGVAHSVETWLPGPTGNWELVGGIYGVGVNGLFAGESMFHRVTDASKVAFVALTDRLRARGFTLFDTQVLTEHTARLGAFEVPRAEYLKRLADAMNQPVTFGPPG